MRESLFAKGCIYGMTCMIIGMCLIVSAAIAQAQSDCTYTLPISLSTTLPHSMPYTWVFSITTNKSSCSWNVEETADWISMAPNYSKSGQGSGRVGLAFANNTSSSSRRATVKIGSKTINITQPGLKQTSTGGSSSTGTGGSSSSKGCTGKACNKGNYRIQ